MGSGMSSTFSLFKDGLYNLLGYIIIIFISPPPPCSYIILIYESVRKLHSLLLRERLYIMATELVRMPRHLPRSSGRCGTAIYTLIITIF